MNKELVRKIKFLLFSISAGAIQLGTYSLLSYAFKLSHWFSYLIGLILSVIWNFTLNRKFTFKSANNVPIAMLKVFGYYCVFTPLSTLLEKFLTETALWPGIIATVLNMVINFVTEYLFDTYVVFRGSIDTNDVANKDASK